MKRPILLLALALSVAACGGTAYGVNASAPAKARTAAKIKVRTTTLGRILVDGRGRTLYEFAKDKARRSRCYGACAANWPPVTTKGRPRAGAGVFAPLLGTTKRRGGARQVTYGGHPLYRYVGDGKPGDTTGQGVDAFGARWYAMRPSGTRAGTLPKPSGTPPPGY